VDIQEPSATGTLGTQPRIERHEVRCECDAARVRSSLRRRAARGFRTSLTPTGDQLDWDPRLHRRRPHRVLPRKPHLKAGTCVNTMRLDGAPRLPMIDDRLSPSDRRGFLLVGTQQ
jgi:hypothetical protein